MQTPDRLLDEMTRIVIATVRANPTVPIVQLLREARPVFRRAA